MSKRDGGPAFAAAAGTATDMDLQPGMSLRDWFAGQALAGMGTWTPGNHGYLTEQNALRARSNWAYEQADAMLAEREKEQTP